MFLKTEVLGKDVLRHVGRLRALIDGQALVAGIPVGNDGARFIGDAGMPAEHEGRFDNRIGFGKAHIDVAGIQCAFKRQVVAELGMDDRCRRIERGFRIGHDRQHFVFDSHHRAGVFRLRAAARHDRADGFALPAGALDGDGVLRRRFDALEMGQHTDPRRDHLCELGAGDDGDNAGRFLCLGGRNFLDPRMGVRRTHKSDVNHARQRNVADILAAALRQPRQIGPRHRTADIGIRPVERGQA